jgi:CIC family chloride channel protein
MGAALGAEAPGAPDSPMPMCACCSRLGGAGLAVAFNAPVAGVLFTLEEVTRTRGWRTVLATVFATATAVGCSRMITGDPSRFRGESPAAARSFVAAAVHRVRTADRLVGVLYNRLVLGFLDGAARVPRLSPVRQGRH